MNEILTQCVCIFQACKSFFPAMIKSNHGHLVCISTAAEIVDINELSDEYFTSPYVFVFPSSWHPEIRTLPRYKELFLFQGKIHGTCGSFYNAGIPIENGSDKGRYSLL